MLMVSNSMCVFFTGLEVLIFSFFLPFPFFFSPFCGVVDTQLAASKAGGVMFTALASYL